MLSSKEKKRLRAIGHTLNPIVTIAGNGFSDGVKAEIERALKDHELIKLKSSCLIFFFEWFILSFF